VGGFQTCDVYVIYTLFSVDVYISELQLECVMSHVRRSNATHMKTSRHTHE